MSRIVIRVAGTPSKWAPSPVTADWRFRGTPGRRADVLPSRSAALPGRTRLARWGHRFHLLPTCHALNHHTEVRHRGTTGTTSGTRGTTEHHSTSTRHLRTETQTETQRATDATDGLTVAMLRRYWGWGISVARSEREREERGSEG